MKRSLLKIFGALIISFTISDLLIAQSEIQADGASAHWVSAENVIWDAGVEAEYYELRYVTESDKIELGELLTGNSISMEPGSELDSKTADKFRHISDRPVFRINVQPDTISEALRGRVLAIAYGDDNEVLAATRVQTAGVIDELYTYNGKLGPIYDDNSITLKLWAPTAQSVRLQVFDDQKNHIEMVEPAKVSNGVLEFHGSRDWDRKFYRFKVDVYHHENDKINTFDVTDPYSVSLSTDSKYSQFVQLSDDDLKPDGWDDIKKEQPRPVDISLYEAHMRDFSMMDKTVPEEHRGTYMAFSHNGEDDRNLSDGMNHLKQLAEAGLTHLHLIPINDIASIYESREKRVDLEDPFNRLCEVADAEIFEERCNLYGDRTIRDVFDELAQDDPVTRQIQQVYSDGLAQHDGFNWGYDPYHFNTPEGSYSTDPDGVQRILETRKMVKHLQEIDLHLVVDVVYNHTHATGDSRYSVLDKVVPGYYQRLNADTGEVETSTCCPNTAAEFNMMEKLIIDSILLWAQEYKIDSFRFDLMGHHPRYVMENVQDALAELTLEDHGVDGKNLYIYGEGWNFGEVADNRIFDQATQFMMGGTGVGNFNDRIRDAIRGGFYSWVGRGQGFANGLYLFPNEESGSTDAEREELFNQADRIRVGMTGNLSSYPYMNRFGEAVNGGNEMIGYAHQPQESVNYIDKHDNETLWDNTQAKLPFDMDMDQRVRIHLLSNAFINYGQGVPFFQLGTDFLRSKSMDRNSYQSGDWFNTVDYTFETHNWGIGLPPEWDNADNWEEHENFLRNPNIFVSKEDMEFTSKVFKDQLRIRYSSPLFRLENADEIHKRVAFHNTGPDQEPGIIAMTISDGVCAGPSLDSVYDGILVIFNSDIREKDIELNLPDMELHSIQLDGTDRISAQARESGGVFTVPALTASVFVKNKAGEQGEFPCNEISVSNN